MENKIEDYLHLYLGCLCANEFFPKDHEEYMKEWKLKGIDRSSFRPYKLETNDEFTWTKEVKPILRPLSSMTDDEADYFAWLCMDSEHHLDEDSRVRQEDVQSELHKNDNATMLDGDIEIYIEVSASCFEGAVVIKKDGSISVYDMDDEKYEPVDDVAHKIVYLLKQGFDLFDLIPAGLAIDSTTLNPK